MTSNIEMQKVILQWITRNQGYPKDVTSLERTSEYNIEEYIKAPQFHKKTLYAKHHIIQREPIMRRPYHCLQHNISVSVNINWHKLK